MTSPFSPMRANTMLATLQWLGVVPSFSRPHVSDDNPYSEALFRTLKHTPAYPRVPFTNCAAAQQRSVGSSASWPGTTPSIDTAPSAMSRLISATTTRRRRSLLAARSFISSPDALIRGVGVGSLATGVQCVSYYSIPVRPIAPQTDSSDKYLDTHRRNEMGTMCPVRTVIDW